MTKVWFVNHNNRCDRARTRAMLRATMRITIQDTGKEPPLLLGMGLALCTAEHRHGPDHGHGCVPHACTYMCIDTVLIMIIAVCGIEHRHGPDHCHSCVPYACTYMSIAATVT